MKSILKKVFSGVAFVAILLVLLIVASLILTPKSNIKNDGMHDPVANAILGEPKNSIDVLILGDSETYCAFAPLKIWQDYGYTSYVCGTAAQRLNYSQEFLRKAFSVQSPKIVILETNAIFRKFTQSDILTQKAEEEFSVFRYHDRWKSLKLKDINFNYETDYTFLDTAKGYSYNKTISPAKTDEYMKKTKLKKEIPSKNRRYVKDIAEFCEENGAEFILVSTPSTKNWNYKKHNAIAALAENIGAQYIDMNTLPDEVNIDWKKDTRDKGDHMNHYGAMKVSSYLGEYFKEQNLFTDKRNDPDYKEWNECVKKFNKSTGNSLKDSN